MHGAQFEVHRVACKGASCASLRGERDDAQILKPFEEDASYFWSTWPLTAPLHSSVVNPRLHSHKETHPHATAAVYNSDGIRTQTLPVLLAKLLLASKVGPRPFNVGYFPFTFFQGHALHSGQVHLQRRTHAETDRKR